MELEKKLSAEEITKLLTDENCKNEAKDWLANAHHCLPKKCEPLLFLSGNANLAVAYLQNHALSESNQHLLFIRKNRNLLRVHLQKWLFSAVSERRLFEPFYRLKFLKEYLQTKGLADSSHEILLFADGMDEYRRCYLSRCCFYSAVAEEKLLNPQYADDLLYYLERGYRMFSKNEEHLREISPVLYCLYVQKKTN